MPPIVVRNVYSEHKCTVKSADFLTICVQYCIVQSNIPHVSLVIGSKWGTPLGNFRPQTPSFAPPLTKFLATPLTSYHIASGPNGLRHGRRHSRNSANEYITEHTRPRNSLDAENEFGFGRRVVACSDEERSIIARLQ